MGCAATVRAPAPRRAHRGCLSRSRRGRAARHRITGPASAAIPAGTLMAGRLHHAPIAWRVSGALASLLAAVSSMGAAPGEQYSRAVFPGSVGGQDMFGPYEVVRDWPHDI